MSFGKGKNRRRQDAAQRSEALKGAVRAHGPSVFRTVCAVLVAASLAYGGFRTWRWAIQAPVFALKTVTFTGVHRALEADLVRMGGLEKGENLFLLKPLEVEKGIATHPWVRHVSVTRHFPAAVVVKIDEHVPAALGVLGDLYLLDEQGEPFKKVEPTDGVNLPLVTGVEREDYLRDPATATARIREALEAMKAYAARTPKGEDALSEVHVERDGLTLVTLSGERVRVGNGDVDSALQRLARVRAELHARGLVADVIHLENRTRPGWVAVKLSTPVSERTKGRE